jgi:NtrC-family two-component system response regulator AlgB
VGVNHLGFTGPTVVNAPRIGSEMTLDDLESAHIASVLANSETLDQAARTLGIDASTLYRKRKQLAL